MLEVLTNSEKVSGDVVVESEVLDGTLDRSGGFSGAGLQPGSVADFGIETLAGYQCFVFLDEREQVERHLIVATSGNIREAIVHDGRHNTTSSRNTDAELTIKAAQASKPGRFSTELKLRSEKEKSITC